jgi:hypothetical protein
LGKENGAMIKMKAEIRGELKGIFSLILCLIVYLLFGEIGALIYIALDILTRLAYICVIHDNIM